MVLEFIECRVGMNFDILLGMNVRAIPHKISNPPIVRRNHLDGIFMFNMRPKGITFAYFTYSVL